MKRFARRFSVAIVVVIWVVLLGLSLEGYEVLRLHRAANASYKYFDDNIGSIPGMESAGRPGFGLNQTSRQPGGSRASDSPANWTELFSGIGSGPCNVAALPPRTADEVQKRRAEYARLGEEQRNVMATVEGRVEITLDPAGRCLNVCGDPLLGQGVLLGLAAGKDDVPPELMRAISQAPTVDRPMECASDFKWNHYEIQTIPRRNARNLTGTILVVARECGDSQLFGKAAPWLPQPEDSMWDVAAYRFKKNFHMGEKQTNRFGFGDIDVAVPRPPGVFRIACVGGSTTDEGYIGMPRYADMLKEILQARFGANAVEVVNCGICGIDSFGERRRVQDYLAVDPNLIVYYNAVNDVSVRHMPVWNDHVSAWQRLLRQSRFLNRWFNHAFLPSEDYVAGFMKATTIRNLRALAYAAGERGVAVALCSFACPDPARLDSAARDYLDINFRNTWQGRYPDYGAYVKLLALHNHLVKQACDEDGLLYIPVAENFHEGMEYFRDICHTKPSGMRLKAEIIAAFISPCIEQRLACPAPASSPPPPSVPVPPSASAASSSPS